MGVFDIFKKTDEVQEIRSETTTTEELKDVLLGGSVKSDINITKDNVLEIPAVKSSVDLISSIVAGLPIELFEVSEDGEINKVTDDRRLFLLNLEPNALSNAYTSKKAMIEDFILDGTGYMYINRNKNQINSLVQVDSSHISYMSNFDVLNPDLQLLVNGKRKELYDFIIVSSSATPDTSKGIIQNNKELLGTMLLSLGQEKRLSSTGGVNRGILKAQNKLSQDAINALKLAWKNLYSSEDNNSAIVLNNGIDFQTVSSNSKDMQLNENKRLNSKLVYEMFNIPSDMLEGQANEETFNTFVKMSINPILTNLELALNKSLLRENEKGKLFFKVNTDELERSDMEKRFKAYEIALKNSIFTIDEVRQKENMNKLPKIGKLIRLSLADVLFDSTTGKIFNTNTSTTTNLINGEETPQLSVGGETENEVNEFTA